MPLEFYILNQTWRIITEEIKEREGGKEGREEEREGGREGNIYRNVGRSPPRLHTRGRLTVRVSSAQRRAADSRTALVHQK